MKTTTTGDAQKVHFLTLDNRSGHAILSIRLLGTGDARVVAQCSWSSYVSDVVCTIDEARDCYRAKLAEGWRKHIPAA